MRLYLVHKAFEVKESNKKWMSLCMVIYGEIYYRVHWIIYCLLIVNSNFSNWILIKFYSFLIIPYNISLKRPVFDIPSCFSTRNKDTSFRCSKWKKEMYYFSSFLDYVRLWNVYKQMYNRGTNLLQILSKTYCAWNVISFSKQYIAWQFIEIDILIHDILIYYMYSNLHSN